MAAALRAVAAARSLLQRRAFSFSAFSPPPPPTPPPKAEPSCNLFVSGLNKRTSSEKLRETFAKYGQLVDARVVTDRVSGFSKGFGFVKYATTQEAEEAIKGMDGQFLEGWVIFVEYARPRPPRPPPNEHQLPSVYASSGHGYHPSGN